MIKTKTLYAELAFIASISNTLMLIQLTFNLPIIVFILLVIIGIVSLVSFSGYWWRHQVALDIEERLKVNPINIFMKNTTEDMNKIKKKLEIE